MKISIVTSYYNRRDLFLNTLKSISLHKYNSDLEIIVIDDASNDENNLDDISELYPKLNIKLIKIKKEDKWWVNPCVPFNKGFDQVTGDVVIIQNPECLHLGNIIKVTEENIKDNGYLVFGCYSINQDETTKICSLEFSNNYLQNIVDVITPIKNRGATNSTHSSWYQHSKYRNGLLHFCAAIKTKDLKELGGFDERFAYGVGKDDREFVIRIKRKKMEIKTIDNQFVIHQRHKPFNYNNDKKTKDNNVIYNMIKEENKIKVNN